jgi:hypothetical protein
MLIFVWTIKGKRESSSPLGERIEVRGQFRGNTITPALSRQGGLIFTHKSRRIRWGMGIINSLLLIVYGVIPYVFMFECARVLLLS